MPKVAAVLTDAAVRKLKHGTIKGKIDTDSTQKLYRVKDIGEACVAYHPVGGVPGLLLRCAPPTSDGVRGARSWILRMRTGVKRQEFGLGGYPEVSLSEARDLAREMRKQIKNGIDPLAEKTALRAQRKALQPKIKTFADYAIEYVDRKNLEFKETSRFKQRQKLENQLKTYVLPFIGGKLPHEIEVTDVLQVLEPIWIEKHETASRVRIHMEGIISMAKAMARKEDLHLYGDNPASMENLKNTTLPKSNKVHKVKHHEALEIDALPGFMRELSQHEGVSYRALEFIILTAVRSGEARGARWEEIDFANKVWTVPTIRTKTGSDDHRVPLSDEAIKVLERMNPKTTGLIFTNSKGTALSDVSVSKIVKKFGGNATVHGFRSTFKDWSRKPGTYNHVPYDDDHTEECLDHNNKTSTQSAYARDDVLEERRPIMQDWAKYAYKSR